MPVTNRGVVQLTPLSTSTATTSLTRNYLSSLPPAFQTVQTGLALFALVIIVRFCAITVYAWLRRLRSADRSDPVSRGAAVLPHHHQPLNHHRRALWAMDEKNGAQSPLGEKENGDALGALGDAAQEEETMGKKLAIDTNWPSSTAFNGGDSLPRPLMARPPPAPPLTPPELSSAVFTFDDRPRAMAIDDSFINQPNPDYMSSTTTAMTVSRETSSSPSIARRRSYNKTLPIGVPLPIPIPQHSSSSSGSDPADLTLSPSSYPPTSPLLPPAPPNAGPKEIDVQGEIIGVLDGDGAGWTRHTRVYGGGVCLACAASGGNHGGGFYGATVRPEEMR